MLLGLAPPQLDHLGQLLGHRRRPGRGTRSGPRSSGRAPSRRRRRARPAGGGSPPSTRRRRWPGGPSSRSTGRAWWWARRGRRTSSAWTARDGELLDAPVDVGSGRPRGSRRWWGRCRSRGGTGRGARPAVGDAVGPVDDERDVDAALVGVLLVPLERGVAGLGPAPRVVRVAVGPADVVDPLDRLVGGLDQKLKYFISCMTPNGPPSWLAPLSDSRIRSVLSSRPRRSRPSTSRPIWASVCSRKAAKASWRRAARRRWLSGRVSHGSTPGLRGASSGVGGEQAHLELAGEPPVAGRVPAVVERARGTSRGRRPGPGGARAWPRRPGR